MMMMMIKKEDERETKEMDENEKLDLLGVLASPTSHPSFCGGVHYLRVRSLIFSFFAVFTLSYSFYFANFFFNN